MDPVPASHFPTSPPSTDPASSDASTIDGRDDVPRVLSIAGSDSGGGAGIQADLKACAARGAFCTTAITALTAQNTLGVQGVHVVPSEFVGRQIRSVLTDIGADVIKTGMLPNVEIIDEIVSVLKCSTYKALVVDPVMISTSGDRLTDSKMLTPLIKNLLPIVDLITPNIFEASILIDCQLSDLQNLQGLKMAARKIHSMGPKNVLIKGGHLENSLLATDILFDGENFHELSLPYLNATNSHGTGCTLASAISAELAKGNSMLTSVQIAKQFVYNLLVESQKYNFGSGNQKPLWHFCPQIELDTTRNGNRRVKNFDPKSLLLYAVTDSRMNNKWNRSIKDVVIDAIRGGATFLQIREKNMDTGEFIKEATEAVEVAKRFEIPIVINDRVDVALACGADGVHVGQSDISVTTARKLLGERAIVGLSAKTPRQAIDGYLMGADYLGVGGVFPTNTKSGNPTIGIRGLSDVCDASRLPIVAIGGIGTETIGELLDFSHQNFMGVAMVSALFDRPDVYASTRSLRETIDAGWNRGRG